MNQNQTNNQTETEVKIWVRDLAALEQKLKAAGATLVSERMYERNVRYEDAAETLTPAERVLRLRQDDRVRLTYKEPKTTLSLKHDDGIIRRTELEVTISDFETMDLLLHKLGFHPAWIYEKYRTTYRLNNCEVVLDELPFGNFLEVEGDTAGIESVLAAIGLATASRITVSYSTLFFRAKTQFGWAFRDLTFENFKSLSLPDDFWNGTNPQGLQ